MLIASRNKVIRTVAATLQGNGGRFDAIGITTTMIHDDSYTILDFLSLSKVRHTAFRDSESDETAASDQESIQECCVAVRQ